MAYRRYIKRNGKNYGPYYYESYKENGRVISKYLGKDESESDSVNFSFFKIFFLIFGFIIFLIFVFLFLNNNFTGKVTLLSEETYFPGEKINGTLKLVLKEGEFIPASTFVKINNSGNENIYLLEELISESKTKGDFFLEDIEINGSGFGYGLTEKSKIYPEVFFTLKIIKDTIEEQTEEDTTEEQAEEDTTEEQTEEDTIEEQTEEDTTEEQTEEDTTEEQAEEDTIEEQTEEDTTEEQTEEDTTEEQTEEDTTEEQTEEDTTEEQTEEDTTEEISPITGSVIREFYEIKGSVNANNSFIYKLKEDESVEILNSSEYIDMDIKENIVTITTNYSKYKESLEEKELLIDLSTLNLTAKEGELLIYIFYKEEIIASLSQKISVKKEVKEIVNETLEDIINDSLIINNTIITKNITHLSDLDLNITTDLVRLNSPVKWRKRFNLTENKNISIDIPGEADKIVVYKIVNKQKEEITISNNSDIEIIEENKKIEKKEFELNENETKKDILEVEKNKTEKIENITEDSNEEESEKDTIKDEELKSELDLCVENCEKNFEICINNSNNEKSLCLNSDNFTNEICDNEFNKAKNDCNIKNDECIEFCGNEKHIPITAYIISGKVSAELELDQKKDTSLILNFIKKIFRTFTGRAIDLNESISLNKTIIIEDKTIKKENSTEFEIEYELPGPSSKEEIISDNKRKIIVYSDYHYKNITAYTYLEKQVPENLIKLYWLKTIEVSNETDNKTDNNSYTKSIRQKVDIKTYNLDNDSLGLVDYIEWIVPHLSNQTYELVIEIYDAEHLDENRSLIQNIYNYVNETDGLTYNIPLGDYVRAYFKSNLTNENVIDIYVINTSNATIKVYEKDSDIVIGEINNVISGLYYISLNHSNSNSIFDLKSEDNYINYDYIHDGGDAPVVQSSRIYSETNRTSSILEGYCNASDAEEDYLDYEYKWYNDSIEYIYGNYFKKETISGRYHHTCGIRENDSRVLCWGEVYQGKLGSGRTGGTNVAIPNVTLDTSAYKSVGCGDSHTCGIRENDSRVLCWGDGSDGQLGDGNSGWNYLSGSPILTTDTSAYKKIAVGQDYACGIRENDSRVLCWGDGLNGRLGNGGTDDKYEPTLTTDTSSYIDIACGEYHTCGIRENDSRVLCWGSGTNGILADGKTGIHYSYNPNVTTDTSAYKYITCGNSHTCGIRENDSRVLCWGFSAKGALGQGSSGPPYSFPNPVLTSDTSAYRSVSCGDSHTCGIRENDSRVLCWGYGYYGRLGNGGTDDKYVPTLTTDTNEYKRISLGRDYTCGIRSNDSRVLCWGWGFYGNLGDGILGDHSVCEPNLTLDTSGYLTGFVSGEEQLVSTIIPSFLSKKDKWILSCRSYDSNNYSNWLNSSLFEFPKCVTTLNVTTAHTISSPTDYDCVYVQNGGTLTINDRLNVDVEMIIYSGGTVTHSVNSGVSRSDAYNNVIDYSVNISAYDLIIESGGKISVNAKGYKPGIDSDSEPDGFGLGGGNGTLGIDKSGGGGGYGGKGGAGENCPTDCAGGNIYGSDKNPLYLGSGGGIGPSYDGGYGGGLLFLDVENILIVNGTISSNGGEPEEGIFGAGGGGSGGSVYLISKEFKGSGTITANGGTGGSDEVGGCGGGGRIAYYYENNTFSGTITANKGSSGYGDCEDGTIFNSDVMSQNRFEVRDSTGGTLSVLDDMGHMYLKGNAFQSQGSLNPGVNSFIIENLTGTIIAYINSTGSLFLSGTVSEFSDLSGRTNTNLEIRDSSDILVAFFDNRGNLKLKRNLKEEYEF
jgi:alpha-tubulin suppressor-like RCC1 family protein